MELAVSFWVSRRWAAVGLAVSVVCSVAMAGAEFVAAETAHLGISNATDVRVSGDSSLTTFELTLSEGAPAEVFTLANPYRVIIDLPDVAFKLDTAAGKKAVGLVSAFRYGLFAEKKARVVIDTAGPVVIKTAAMANSDAGVVLKLALAPTDIASFGAGTGASRQAATSATDSKLAAPDTAVPKQHPAAKPVIVIDPGHGGIDPGAAGAGGTMEKSIVLAVALQLKAALSQGNRFDVRMTRTTDVFVSLDKRLKFSADNGADLFVSLHADSIEEHNLAENIRGATIYTLSERASDEQARLMAEKENSSDLIAGLETGDGAAKDQVKNILIDLLKRETSNFSADFSNVLAGRLRKTITLSRDPQRSAAFKVLKQAHAPSVLVELGYVSNSKDQAQMTSAIWQNQVAASIAAAVQAYFVKRTAEQR